MGILSAYARVAITKGTAGTPSKYNESTYTNTTIYGVKESVNKLVRDQQGAEVVAGTMVMTETSVAVGDKLDGDIVVRVDTIRDIEGNVSHYEAYTK